MSQRYVFIGASAASFGAVQSVCRLDQNADITLICAEDEWPYNKCLLADYLAGSIEQSALSIYTTVRDQVKLLLSERVIRIDTKAKSVTTHQGTIVSYDVLFLGMGSAPAVPQIPGVLSPGVFTFHTNADANAILGYAQKNAVKNIVIVGAGLSGLEAADALIRRGYQITIVERNSQLLPAALCKAGSDFLYTIGSSLGVQILCGSLAQEICAQNGRVCGIRVNGHLMPADMVIIATGLKQNLSLCESAGIVYDAHGVVVNEYLQTNFSDIYAGGDLIGVQDTITGQMMRSCLWPDAMQQGMHAGMAMSGAPKAYKGALIITSTAFFGIKYARAGCIACNNETFVQQGADFHHTFSISNGVLIGFQVLGTRHNLGLLRRWLLTKHPVSREQLSD